jgi:hypothetical protein
MTSTEAPPAFVPSTPACTVPGMRLARIIQDVLPFAADGQGVDDLSQLRGVLLEAQGGTLTATATDRYSLAHSRGECEGSLPGRLLIRRSEARLLAETFRSSRAPVAIYVTDAGPVKVVRFAGKSIGDVTPDGEDPDSYGYGPEVGELVDVTVRTMREPFPTYDTLFNDGEKPSGVSQAIGVNPKLLTRCSAAVDGRDVTSEMRVYTYGDPNRQIRVEVGDDFAAVIMPIKLGPNRYGGPVDGHLVPVVPIGHSQSDPAQPAEAA